MNTLARGGEEAQQPLGDESLSVPHLTAGTGSGKDMPVTHLIVSEHVVQQFNKNTVKVTYLSINHDFPVHSS